MSLYLILHHAKIPWPGIVEQEFTVEGQRLRLFDVGGQRNERRKWLH